MSKLEIAVVRYEKARALVANLKYKHSTLTGCCSGLDTSEDNHGMVVSIGEPCGVTAWKYITEEEDDYVSFEDALLVYINGGHGACDSCIEAYKLKHGDLAKAKAEFGNAKRSISYHGKRLITKG